MRILMGIVRKKANGNYVARKRVPEDLQVAVGRLTSPAKDRVAWLQQSLGTKDIARANVLGKHVLMEFDRIIEKAKASTARPAPQRDLSDQEIERIASYSYSEVLEEDEEVRTHGLYPDEQKVPGIDPDFGLSSRQMEEFVENTEGVLAAAQDQLSRGDTATIQSEVERLLEHFGLAVDQKSPAFRKLSMAVLRQFVRALKALQQRNQGEPVETPKAIVPTGRGSEAATGETLKAALAGWKKARNPSTRTVQEFNHGIAMFVELHGDMPVQQIRRTHIREWREALQEVPKRRTGSLRRAPLPELVKWGKAHPTAERISASTINKSLGAVQAVGLWARDNGLIPDDVP